jgi:hypothetical protein
VSFLLNEKDRRIPFIEYSPCPNSIMVLTLLSRAIGIYFTKVYAKTRFITVNTDASTTPPHFFSKRKTITKAKLNPAQNKLNILSLLIYIPEYPYKLL